MPACRHVPLAALAVIGALAAAPAAASADLPADAPAASGAATRADGGFPLRAGATQRRGVSRIAGMRVSLRRGPTSLREARRTLGAPAAVVRDEEVCTASWDGGLQLDFVTFGGEERCGKRPLQAATLTGDGWTVRVGDRRYRIGQPRSAIPDGARRIRRWGGGGYELATVPFAGRATTTVLAHVAGGRIDRFYLWVGGAGD